MATTDFQVNLFETFAQYRPDAVRLADGSLVIAWSSIDQDGNGAGIYFRRMTKDGVAIGFETRANTETFANQQHPEIAALSDGGFVLTWDSDLQDGEFQGVFGQRFDRAGDRIGEEFQVNTTTSSNQVRSDLTGLRDGGWVVTWTDFTADGSSLGIYQQRYSALGIRVGEETLVNASTDGDQDNSDVTALDNGGWVVAWASAHPGPTPTDREIFFQRYNANGDPVGGETQVSFGTGDREDAPAITTLANGDFVVTWFTNFTGDAQIYGRVFRPNGAPRSAEFTVSDPAISPTNGFQSIDALDDGGFVISWQDFEGSSLIYHRSYDADGSARGPQVTSGAKPGNNSIGSTAVVSLDGNGFGVFWEGDDLDIHGAFHGRGTDRDDIETMTSSGAFFALDGDDFVMGSSGEDDIYGGDGVDLIYGEGQDDFIHVGDFNFSAQIEIAYGGAGDDVVLGSTGADTLYGDGGGDILKGREGADSLYGGFKSDVLKGGSGADYLDGGKGDDVIRGGDGDDLIFGGDGDDILSGGAGGDVVRGGAGDDRLTGGGGDDVLRGGDGKDRVQGDAGDDVLTGGEKKDKFWFNAPDWGDDVITDFEDGLDTVRMKGTGASGFGDLSITDLADDALVEFAGQSIVIQGMSGLLDASDFTF